ncbi:hypothetical protein Tco_0440428, partial [Tanacetum coccineum]
DILKMEMEMEIPSS